MSLLCLEAQRKGMVIIMKPSGKAAKCTASVTLKGKWPAAIGVCMIVAFAVLIRSLAARLLYTVFSLHLSTLRGLLTLSVSAIDLFAFSPLYIGALRWFWQVTAGVDEPVASIFYYYSFSRAYFNAVLVRLNYWWRTVIISVIAFIPYSILRSMSKSIPKTVAVNIGYSALIGFLAVVAAVLGALVVLMFLTKYYLVLPVMFSDDTVTVGNAFRLSAVMSRGNRVTLFFMVIPGFAGWILLSLLVVPMIYTVPYFIASLTVFSRYSITAFRINREAAQA